MNKIDRLMKLKEPMEIYQDLSNIIVQVNSIISILLNKETTIKNEKEEFDIDEELEEMEE